MTLAGDAAHNDGSIRLQRVEDSDEGSYSCSVHLGNLTFQKTVVLRVIQKEPRHTPRTSRVAGEGRGARERAGAARTASTREAVGVQSLRRRHSGVQTVPHGPEGCFLTSVPLGASVASPESGLAGDKGTDGRWTPALCQTLLTASAVYPPTDTGTPGLMGVEVQSRPYFASRRGLSALWRRVP